ncbi:hypothetical protein SDC9_175222 [bioreactor metagenome]|uniref:Uncharacterized protein n=1 Tax=bioreactor metagenome TaxID=1076179 RepID=A0A645GLI7_9ZZZZ
MTGTSVVVTGDLNVGDTVQLSTSSTTSTSSTQEGSNIMQLGGSVSGGGGMPSGGAPSGGGPGGN